MRMRRLAAVRVRNMARGLFVPVGRIMCLTPGLLSFVLRQGGLMVAMHRRPPLTVAPPPELVTFDPDEWPGGEWWQSFELWGDARMAFVKAHPGSELGSALDVLREKRRIREQRRRSLWEAG
jgi:hypothetical protein